MPGTKTDHLGVLVFNVSTVTYTDWECVRQQNWLPANAHTQCSYCVSHTLRGCWVTQLNPCECPLQCLYCVYALRVYQVTKFIRWECPHSTSPLRFTCSERVPWQKIDSLGVVTSNVSIVHALRGYWATKLIPWECPHSILLCFTCFEKMLGNKIDFLGVSTYNISIAFYTLWEEAE